MLPEMTTNALGNGPNAVPPKGEAKYYSLSVSAENRDRLEKLRRKKELEIKIGVSWDNFFSMVIDDLEKIVMGEVKKAAK